MSKRLGPRIPHAYFTEPQGQLIIVFEYSTSEGDKMTFHDEVNLSEEGAPKEGPNQ